MTSRFNRPNSLYSQDYSELYARRRKAHQVNLEAQREGIQEFTRLAYGYRDEAEDSNSRKIVGHPHQEACTFVGGIFSEFDAHGRIGLRVVNTRRIAGRGAHGITDGEITVQVDLKPLKGMHQSVEVPIQVRSGYMYAPSTLYHEGVPHIIAQSSIDDILERGEIADRDFSTRTPRLYGPARKAMHFEAGSFSTREADALDDTGRWYDLQGEKEDLERWVEETRNRKYRMNSERGQAEFAWAVDRVFELEDEMAQLKGTIEAFMADAQKQPLREKTSPLKTLWNAFRKFKADAEAEDSRELGFDLQAALRDVNEFELSRQAQAQYGGGSYNNTNSSGMLGLQNRNIDIRQEADYDCAAEGDLEMDAEGDLEMDAAPGRQVSPSNITREQYEQMKARQDGASLEDQKAKERRKLNQKTRESLTEPRHMAQPLVASNKTAGGYAASGKLLSEVVTMMEMNVPVEKIKLFLHERKTPPEMFQTYLEQGQKRLQALKAKEVENRPGIKQEFNKDRGEVASKEYDRWQGLKFWKDKGSDNSQVGVFTKKK